MIGNSGKVLMKNHNAKTFIREYDGLTFRKLSNSQYIYIVDLWIMNSGCGNELRNDGWVRSDEPVFHETMLMNMFYISEISKTDKLLKMVIGL